ncbi:MAG: hypothetical protein MZV70_28410 [Desulfobacterales bacterium]|nr:hypothetical protein [Desulfobacterales bacterium]
MRADRHAPHREVRSPGLRHNARRMEKIYSVINNSRHDDGVLFLVTPRDCLIEAQVYGRIIIQCKSRALSPDEILRDDQEGDHTGGKHGQGGCRSERCRSRRSSPAPCPRLHAYVFKPGDPDALKSAKLVSLLTCLTRVGGGRGR